MKAEVKNEEGGGSLVLPNRTTLRLPKLGEMVRVKFPGREWLCPALVVGGAHPANPRGEVELFVFNKFTQFQKVHHRHKVPHSALANGTEPYWFWPS